MLKKVTEKFSHDVDFERFKAADGSIEMSAATADVSSFDSPT